MGSMKRYIRKRDQLLCDERIGKANIKLFARYLDQEENRIKKERGLENLDESCYRYLCDRISNIRQHCRK